MTSSPRPSMESPGVTSPESTTCCDSTTQTEWTGGWESPSPMGVFPFSQTSLVQSHQMALFDGDVMEHHYETLEEVLDHQEEDEDDEDEEEGCELEYEEITLRRTHCEEKLGLTLCYAAPEDEHTDIFVSEIDPDSVASRDGRIFEGDQLLQINGVDVNNRRHAVELFSSKEPEVTILVARPHLQDEEDDEECEEQQDDLNHTDASNRMKVRAGEATPTETGMVEIFPRYEKDSGVGRTDCDSTRHDESSEHEDIPTNTSHSQHPTSSRITFSCANGDLESSEGCEHFPEALDQRCASTSTSSLLYEEIDAPLPQDTKAPTQDDDAISRVQSDTSLDREMAQLNQEMENIQVECESLVSRHIREQWFKCHAGHSFVTYGEPSPSTIPQNVSPFSVFESNRAKRRPHEPLPRPPPPPPPPPPPIPPPRNQIDKKQSVAQWVKSVSVDKKPKSVFSKLFAAAIEERDSSSAYHTGESSRSTPLTLELAPIPDLDRTTNFRGSMMSLVTHPRLVDKSTQLTECDVASVVSCDTCRYCQVIAHRDTRGGANPRFAHFQNSQRMPYPMWDLSSPAKIDSTAGPGTNTKQKLPAKPHADGYGREFIERTGERNRNYVTFYPCATMYTNQENLQHTIWLQQQLFRQALAQKYYKKPTAIPTCAPINPKESFRQKYSSLTSTPTAHSAFLPQTTALDRPVTAPTRTVGSNPMTPQANEETQMEWKVKRRPDGTRYITRRPVRNKILKERAMKIMEERCGVTTDDDAISELKVGRYWSKEERKKHLEKARDRKQRKETLLKSKMFSVKERPDEKDDSSQNRRDCFFFEGGAPSCVSVGHSKKTARRKTKTPSAPSSAIMDEGVDRESTTHSLRGSNSGTKSFGILSVTTV